MSGICDFTKFISLWLPKKEYNIPKKIKIPQVLLYSILFRILIIHLFREYFNSFEYKNRFFIKINNWAIPHKLNERGIKWTIYILRLKTKKACKGETIPASLNFWCKTYEKGQNTPILAIKRPQYRYFSYQYYGFFMVRVTGFEPALPAAVA